MQSDTNRGFKNRKKTSGCWRRKSTVRSCLTRQRESVAEDTAAGAEEEERVIWIAKPRSYARLLIDWRAAGVPLRPSSDAEKRGLFWHLWASRNLISGEERRVLHVNSPSAANVEYNHHSNATKRPSRGRRGFWSPFGETLIKRRSVNHLKLGTLSSYLFSDIWRWFTFVLLFRSLPFCTSAPGLNKSITLTHDILLFCNLCTRSNLQVLQKQ